MTAMQVFVWVLALPVAILNFMFLYKKWFRKEPDQAEAEAEVETSPSVPPTGSADNQDSGKPATGREAQDQRIRARMLTGQCLFCDERAHKQMPTYKPQRSIFDGVYRMLNVVPLDRYKIVLDRGIDIPFALCEKHHERVRGLFEKRIAKASADVADFFDEQRESLYVFERYELYERVEADMNAAKRGKPKSSTPPVKNVVDLKSVKKTGSDAGNG